MCCNALFQPGVHMSCCRIHEICTIHSQVLQSRHEAADHIDHRNSTVLFRISFLFDSSWDYLENLEVLLGSSGCFFVYCCRSTLLAKHLWSLQKKNCKGVHVKLVLLVNIGGYLSKGKQRYYKSVVTSQIIQELCPKLHQLCKKS